MKKLVLVNNDMRVFMDEKGEQVITLVLEKLGDIELVVCKDDIFIRYCCQHIKGKVLDGKTVIQIMEDLSSEPKVKMIFKALAKIEFVGVGFFEIDTSFLKKIEPKFVNNLRKVS